MKVYSIYGFPLEGRQTSLCSHFDETKKKNKKLVRKSHEDNFFFSCFFM